MDIDNIVIALQTAEISPNIWQTVLLEPFLSEDKINPGDPNAHAHTRHVVCIVADQLPKYICLRKHTRDLIGRVMFLYMTPELREWDEHEWLCIGQSAKPKLFFAYKTNRCGTGFGLGEESTLYFAQSVKELLLHALTEKDRDLVANHIHAPVNIPRKR